jgi:hypothetical protein
MEFLRRTRPFAKLRRDVIERGTKLAEHAVALQPKARHLAEVRVCHPLLARIALEQEFQLGGPSETGIKV